MYLFVFSYGYCHQERDTVSLTTDTGQVVEARSFPTNLKLKYQGKDFDYERTEGEAKNLLERFLNWAFQGLRDTFGFDLPPYLLKIIEYLIYVLMGILALYLLIKFLVGENLSSVFAKKAAPVFDMELSEEQLTQVDFDALIQTALEKKDYRLAIRYQYLKVLKTLSQKNIIEWHFDKTNLDYQKEIRTPGTKAAFKEVSYLYDHIWYGEKELDEIKYHAAQRQFTTLNETLG